MTESQLDAFSQIEQLLREHFEGGAFVVLTDTADDEEQTLAGWHGGAVQAIGLFEVGKQRALEDGLEDDHLALS